MKAGIGNSFGGEQGEVFCLFVNGKWFELSTTNWPSPARSVPCYCRVVSSVLVCGSGIVYLLLRIICYCKLLHISCEKEFSCVIVTVTDGNGDRNCELYMKF